MSGCLEEAPIDKKREALELLGVKVYVWRHDHDPRYKIDFAPVSIVAIPSQLPRHKREEKTDNVSELHAHNPAQILNIVSATLPLHIRSSIIAGSEQVDLR